MAVEDFNALGIPDLIISLNGLFIAIELKTDEGKPTALQLWNIEQIKKSGGQAYILRPKDFEKWKEEINVQLQQSNNIL